MNGDELFGIATPRAQKAERNEALRREGATRKYLIKHFSDGAIDKSGDRKPSLGIAMQWREECLT